MDTFRFESYDIGGDSLNCVFFFFHCNFTGSSFMGFQIVGRLLCCRASVRCIERAVATCKPYQNRSEQEDVISSSHRLLPYSLLSTVKECFT